MPLTFVCSAQKKNSVLVFSKTAAFYHASIPHGIAAIQKLGIENNFTVDTTKNAEWFTTARLKKYGAVIFLSTTGDVLNDEQQKILQQYVLNGGGFVGIHSATDTEYDWPWYNQLVGAYFVNHPEIQKATIMVIDNTHPSTKSLPEKWERTDECYNFRDFAKDLHVLCKLDESTYKGGTLGENHPYSWYHSVGKGRSFYTAGGHTKESYVEPLFLEHLLGGIKYALGKK